MWAAVLENTEVKKYPKDEVKEMSDSLMEQYQTMAEYYEQDLEDFIQAQMGMSMEDFESQVDEAVKSSIKQSMVTEAIAKQEKIEPTKKEYNKEYKELAAAYNYADVDALKEAVDEEDLKEVALNNIVLDWLVDNCIQVAGK